MSDDLLRRSDAEFASMNKVGMFREYFPNKERNQYNAAVIHYRIELDFIGDGKFEEHVYAWVYFSDKDKPVNPFYMTFLTFELKDKEWICIKSYSKKPSNEVFYYEYDDLEKIDHVKSFLIKNWKKDPYLYCLEWEISKFISNQEKMIDEMVNNIVEIERQGNETERILILAHGLSESKYNIQQAKQLLKVAKQNKKAPF